MAGPRERTFVATPIPSGGGRIIATPFQFWTSGEDGLRITSVCAMTGVALKIQGRFVGPDGVITAASWDHTCAPTRVPVRSEFPLGIGAVLNLVVFAVGGAPKIAQVLVIVQLIRGAGAAAIVLGTLLQGYVTTTQALAWPGSPIVNSLEALPATRRITGTQPAAGQEISETVPTGARWRLFSLNAFLTTSATVATRTASVIFTEGFSDFFGSGQPVGVAASSGIACWWSEGMPLTTQVGFIGTVAGLTPDNRLLAGAQFATRTSNLKPGDQWSAPSYQVQEWLEAT